MARADKIRDSGASPLTLTEDALTEVFNDTVTTVLTLFGSPFVIHGWAGTWVHIRIDSTGAPTSVRVLPQFQNFGDGRWWDFEEGLWASLMWEDTDTADGVQKVFNLPCGGQNIIRLVVIGVGTDDQGADFDVEILVNPYRPPVGMAHA